MESVWRVSLRHEWYFPLLAPLILLGDWHFSNIWVKAYSTESWRVIGWDHGILNRKAWTFFWSTGARSAFSDLHILCWIATFWTINLTVLTRFARWKSEKGLLPKKLREWYEWIKIRPVGMVWNYISETGYELYRCQYRVPKSDVLCLNPGKNPDASLPIWYLNFDPPQDRWRLHLPVVTSRYLKDAPFFDFQPPNQTSWISLKHPVVFAIILNKMNPWRPDWKNVIYRWSTSGR